MSEKEQIDDLQERMKTLRNLREKKRVEDPGNSDMQELMSSVRATIKPIVRAFVKEDRSLMIQSMDNRCVFIGYGYHTVCRIIMSATNSTTVNIQLESDAGTEHVYSGVLDKEKLQTSVKDALLRWYLLVS